MHSVRKGKQDGQRSKPAELCSSLSLERDGSPLCPTEPRQDVWTPGTHAPRHHRGCERAGPHASPSDRAGARGLSGRGGYSSKRAVRAVHPETPGSVCSMSSAPDTEQGRRWVWRGTQCGPRPRLRDLARAEEEDTAGAKGRDGGATDTSNETAAPKPSLKPEEPKSSTQTGDRSQAPVGRQWMGGRGRAFRVGHEGENQQRPEPAQGTRFPAQSHATDIQALRAEDGSSRRQGLYNLPQACVVRRRRTRKSALLAVSWAWHGEAIGAQQDTTQSTDRARSTEQIHSTAHCVPIYTYTYT